MDANSALQFGDAGSAALNGSSFSGNLASARQRYQTDLDAQQKDMQPAIEQYRQTASQPLPAVPEPKKAAPAPDQQQFQKDSQGWMTAITALSALVGSRGRARGTGALKAFAAGMNGIQKGNQQAFEDSYKTWRANTDAMMDENKQEMEKYNAILNNRDLTEQEAFNEIKMVGFEHENKLMMDAKDFEQAAAIYESAVKAHFGAQTYIDKMDAKAKEQIAQQEKAKQEQDKRYEEWKQTPRANLIADAVAKGLPPSYYIKGRGKEGEEQLQFAQDYAMEKHPDLDLAAATEDYKAASSALRSFGNGRQADTVRSFNVAYSHADILNDLATALGNGDVQLINAAKQRFEQEFGNPAPTNFDAVKGIFADEVNKAAVGGAGALGDREQLRANIGRSTSPEQISGAVNVYKNLIVGQMQGMKLQYEQATGRKDFDRFLLPEVDADLKNKTASHAGGGNVAAPSGGDGWSISPVE